MPTPPRRLNLGDGMILVAGSALGLLLTRQYLRVEWSMVTMGGNAPPWALTSCLMIGWYGRLALVWLAALGAVLLLWRLRRPRPRIGRLFLLPGTMASLTSALFCLAGMLAWLSILALGDRRVLGSPSGDGATIADQIYPTTFLPSIELTGPAIGACWLNLVLARRWRPERSVIDRAGRSLGFSWLVASLSVLGSDLTSRFLVAQINATLLILPPVARLTPPPPTPLMPLPARVDFEEFRKSSEDREARLEALSRSGNIEQIRVYLHEQIKKEQESRSLDVPEGADMFSPRQIPLADPVPVPVSSPENHTARL